MSGLPSAESPSGSFFLAVVPSLPLLNFITVAENSLQLEDLPKTCSANALFHSIIFIKPSPYLLPPLPHCKGPLVVNHISHWHVCLTVGTLMDCFPALNLQKGPNLIEFPLIAWYVVAFRMVKTINSIAEKKRSTQFLRLDRMLTENTPFLKQQSCSVLFYGGLLLTGQCFRHLLPSDE